MYRHLKNQIKALEYQWALTALRREIDRLENDLTRSFLTNPHNTFKGTVGEYIYMHDLHNKAWKKISKHYCNTVLPYPFKEAI